MAAPAELKNVVLTRVQSLPQESSVKAPSIVTKTGAGSDAWRWAAVAAAVVIAGVYVTKENQLRSANYSLISRERELERVATELSALKTAGAALQSQMQALQSSIAGSSAANEALKQQLAERSKMADDLKLELAKLTEANDSAKTQIAMLQSTVEEYKAGVAVVVWNPEKQEGILKLEKMPPIQTGKDYQLWVVDPARKTPVSAGVVRVDDKGFAKVDFKPVFDIKQATNFAISVEKEGGVQENAGPIVLLSP